jgi:hypothetical protein
VPFIKHAFLQQFVDNRFLRGATAGLGDVARVHEHGFGIEVRYKGQEDAEGEV